MTLPRRSFMQRLAASIAGLVAVPKVLDAIEPAPPPLAPLSTSAVPLAPLTQGTYYGTFDRRAAYVYVDGVEVHDVLSVETTERYGWPGVEHRVRCYVTPENHKIIARINAMHESDDPRIPEVRALISAIDMQEFEFVARVSKLPPAFVRIEYSSDHYINVQTTYSEDHHGGYRKTSQKTTQRMV